MEGTTNSLDTPLYDALFPDLSVIPKGSCIDVQRAVSGLRGSQDLHHVEAFGLIDRDDRPDEEIDQLAEDRVFALDVCSAEALYYCSDAIAAVARRQAESLGCNADELIRSATRKALDVLIRNGLAKQMAARRGRTPTAHRDLIDSSRLGGDHGYCKSENLRLRRVSLPQ